ncbi:MAG: ubiquinol-cytochrome C chaperone family protein [Rhodospirillales bacterium]|nr:ubiquinol-cytochrome C chaperone family protein [Rhodospirillales bacterium]
MLGKFFSRSRFDETTRRLHDVVVAQARDPILYAEYGVPDTLDGRFEMVVLHALLVMRRLRTLGEEGEELSQKLFDFMFVDFDRALREIGVGDLSVGRRIKKMAQAFYGRAANLDEALVADDDAALSAFLVRNAYGTVNGAEEAAGRLALCVREQVAHLDPQEAGSLLAGDLTFSPMKRLQTA